MLDGWVGGWLENEFLNKTPSPKLDLSPSLGPQTFEFVNSDSASKIFPKLKCQRFYLFPMRKLHRMQDINWVK